LPNQAATETKYSKNGEMASTQMYTSRYVTGTYTSISKCLSYIVFNLNEIYSPWPSIFVFINMLKKTQVLSP